MARLGGWDRVAIILWVLWSLGVGIFTYNVGMNHRLSMARHDCREAYYGAPASFNLDECINKNIAHHLSRLWMAALAMSAVAALFAPFPLIVWQLVSLILFCGREYTPDSVRRLGNLVKDYIVTWVKRGFIGPGNSN